jgi:hypothetical protein
VDDLANATNEGDANAVASPLALSPLQEEAQRRFAAITNKEEKAAALVKSVKKAVASYLFDPASAQFMSLREGRRKAICGKLNAKNRYGAYVGFKDFVLLPGGELDVSAHNDGLGTELYTSFAESFASACATPVEVRSYEADKALDRALSNHSQEQEAPEDPFET